MSKLIFVEHDGTRHTVEARPINADEASFSSLTASAVAGT